MTNPNTPPVPTEPTPPGTEPQGQTPATPPQGQTPAGNQKTSIDSLPPDIQEYIKSLRADAKKYRDASEAEAKAKQAAEEQRLKEQGEFKQLAEKHETRVKELEPKAQELAELAELFTKQVQEQMKDWPQEVKNFYPGDDAPIKQRLDWLDKSRALVERLNQQRPSSPGNRPNPPAVGSVNEPNKNTIMKELLESGIYGVSRSGRL